MQKWQQRLLQELLTICTDLTKGYALDRNGLAQKLRQLAFEVDTDKQQNK